jgi:hypothetical protein
MTERVQYPQFELYGPPCKDEACKGVLILTARKDAGVFDKCSECGKEFEKMMLKPLQTIAEVLNMIDKKALTVAELIEKLKEMPQDLVVRYETDDGNGNMTLEVITDICEVDSPYYGKFVEVFGDK